MNNPGSDMDSKRKPGFLDFVCAYALLALMAAAAVAPLFMLIVMSKR